VKEQNQQAEGNGNQVAGRDIIQTNHISHCGTVNLNLTASPRIKVVCQPGPQHICDERKATLKRLVDEIVKAEKAVKRSPNGYATVWKALCGKMRCTSYHLIAVERAGEAETYLRQWLGRLSSAKSAPAKDPDWRKRKYAYINVNIKQFDLAERLTWMLVADYQAGSLSALSDEQLGTVYQRVAEWKRAARLEPGAA
jgi:hypothetical protein